MNIGGGRQHDDVDINVTSLIDVVLLLVIFFVVSTTFEREAAIELTLPEAAEDTEQKPAGQIDVAIDRQGVLFVNGARLPDNRTDTLRGRLAAAKRGIDEPIVVIAADQSATHQAVISVMDAARQVGLYRITFPTRLRDEESD
jgi:biopolymer transport protein ExbD